MSKAKKTIVVTVDNKGGVGKSVSSAFFADGLEALGYRVGIADGDMDNLTVTEIFKGASLPVNIDDSESLDDFLAQACPSPNDLWILDMPGRSSKNFGRYIENIGVDALNEAGVRLVLALAISETSDAIDGAINWVTSFSGIAEFLILASGKDSKDTTLNLQAVMGAEELLKIAQGRIVNIPKLSDVLHEQFKKVKATPASFGLGEAKKELALSYLHASRWKKYRQDIIDQVEPVAPWLTGKPVPNSLARKPSEKTQSTKFQSLIAQLEEARQARKQKKPASGK